MKKSLQILIFLFGLFLFSSCHTNLRVTKKNDTTYYRDFKIDKKIVVKNNHAYAVRKNGIPINIDLDVYTVEVLSKKTKNQNFFLILSQQEVQSEKN